MLNITLKVKNIIYQGIRVEMGRSYSQEGWTKRLTEWQPRTGKRCRDVQTEA